jgi:hypothetical protein
VVSSPANFLTTIYPQEEELYTEGVTLISVSDSGSGNDSVLAANIVIVSDTGSGAETIGIIAKIPITDSGAGTESIIVGTVVVRGNEYGHSEDDVNIIRLYPPTPPSGAIPFTSDEAAYVTLSYHQMIDMVGTPILYRIVQTITDDDYEHPNLTYYDQTIQGVIGNDMSQEPYEFVDVGFLPAHYAKVWVYQVTPEIGDRVVWKDLVWEVRNSIPRVIGSLTLYYDVILRRVLTEGTLTAGGDGTSAVVDEDDP